MYFHSFTHWSSPLNSPVNLPSKSTLYQFCLTPERTELVHLFELERRCYRSEVNTLYIALPIYKWLLNIVDTCIRHLGHFRVL